MKLRPFPCFLISLFCFILSFFMRSNLASINDTQSALSIPPLQGTLSYHAPVKITQDGFTYSFTLHHLYEISGMVTSKSEHPIIINVKSPPQFNLSLIWGKAVSQKIYKEIRYSWVDGEVTYPQRLKKEEAIDVGVAASDVLVEKKLRELLPGDQVRLRGYWVSSFTADREKSTQERWNHAEHKSMRDFIYVERVELLQKGNPFYRALFPLSGLAALLSALWGLFLLGLPEKS